MDFIDMLGGKEEFIKICKQFSKRLNEKELEFMIEALQEDKDKRKGKKVKIIEFNNFHSFQKRKILSVLAKVYNVCFDKLTQKRREKNEPNDFYQRRGDQRNNSSF